MKHKWKKIDSEGFFDETYINEDGNEDTRPHFSRDNRECIYCGLKRGSCRTMGFFPRMTYYRNKKLLSVDRIPYSCIPVLKEINEDLNEDFLSIEEMII